MQNNKSPAIIRVVAAVVDTRELTLYKEDGSTVVIKQGDPRLARIVTEITPVLSAGASVVEVSLARPMAENPYRDYEEKTGGVVRFFRVAKKALAGLFGGTNREPPATLQGTPVPSQVIGTVPSPPTLNPFIERSNLSAEDKRRAQLLATTEEIIANATPASAPNFSDEGLDTDNKDEAPSEETMIAVVQNEGEPPKVIPEAQHLKNQVAHAVQTGKGSEAIQAFLDRMATVAQMRAHSAEDLMKFLRKGDLPLAQDGSIIAYKLLRRTRNTKGELDGYYVDCHTERVRQRVGSIVCMDPKLVDPNRYNECSSGLHIARRAYLQGFPGDVCVLVRIRPEDVIAVPHHDPNKMRVCAYQILFELPEEAYRKVKANKPFTDSKVTQTLLGRALAGDYDPAIEEVRITQKNGHGIIVTPLGNPIPPSAPEPVKVERAVALADVTEAPTAPLVDPKQVVETVVETKKKTLTRAEFAQELYARFDNAGSKEQRKALATELLAYKKKTKLGWATLGLREEVGTELQNALA